MKLVERHKTAIAILLLLLLGPVSANENWIREGSTDDSDIYVNFFDGYQKRPTGPVVRKKVPGGQPDKLYGMHEPRDSDSLRCWLKYVYKTPKSGKVYETKMYIELTRGGTVEILDAIDYGRNGSVLFRRSGAGPSRIIPDSIASEIYRSSFGEDGQHWWYDAETERTGTPFEDTFKEFKKSQGR